MTSHLVDAYLEEEFRAERMDGAFADADYQQGEDDYDALAAGDLVGHQVHEAVNNPLVWELINAARGGNSLRLAAALQPFASFLDFDSEPFAGWEN